MTSLDFPLRKKNNQKISMITCYDAAFGRIVNNSNVDCILVGDSCAMVMHGNTTTLPATIEMMCMHTAAVRSGAPDKFIVTDMPFLAVRRGCEYAVTCAGQILCAGANAVKIEGCDGQEDIMRYLVESGIPVMGHLGLTPQFYNSLGGFKMQGKTDEAAKKLLIDAKKLEKCGCFGIVMECIPANVTVTITENLSIPVIGIGAGPDADGQVLVLQDMLGMSNFTPKFVKKFADVESVVKHALNTFAEEITTGIFPIRN